MGIQALQRYGSRLEENWITRLKFITSSGILRKLRKCWKLNFNIDIQNSKLKTKEIEKTLGIEFQDLDLKFQENR